jgi:hypothetical protein
MLIDKPGTYITKGGFLVKVESTDGYRRAYGKDSKGSNISWYTETGYVRSGTCNGNDIVTKLNDEKG